MNSVNVFSPAKINLFLAVTGRRPDGFHDLVSLAAPVKWGDGLTVNSGPTDAEGSFSLECTDPLVPVDGSNLVLKAAEAFRAATGWRGGAKFLLEKRIPMGAGLGGGSSNAVAALRALDALAGEPLGATGLGKLAVQIGSDCALFLHDGPVVMRGRGEIVEPLGSSSGLARLRGRRVLVFKPGFGIATGQAYAALARGGGRPDTESNCYVEPAEAEARLAGWLRAADAPAEALLFNSFERATFAKHLALPVLLDRLRTRFGLAPLMTGSGSACFALLGEKTKASVGEMTGAIREAWGPSAFVVETMIA